MSNFKQGEQRTPIEHLLALLSAQTDELHRLAIMAVEPPDAPTKPAKRVDKKR